MKKINEIIERIKPLNSDLMEKAQKRLDNLTKPRGSLGLLEEIAKTVVGIKEEPKPLLKRKIILTLAGDHGVAEEGVSLYPQEVTCQMVHNFLGGGAGINVLASHVGAEVIVVDMGVKGELKIKSERLRIKKIGYGTKNIAKGPAMSRKEAIESILRGIEVFEEEHEKEKIDIVGVGDMGIGNTTPSSCIVACITSSEVPHVTSRGTGIDDERLEKKVEVIKRALDINKPDPEDPIDILGKVGGFEIGGIAGIFLASAANIVPAILDGFISTAGALIAAKLAPLTRDYMIASHQSVEKGHKIALGYLGKKPLFDLSMRLGEGTGSAIAMSIVEGACRILNEMATFNEAGVSNLTDDVL